MFLSGCLESTINEEKERIQEETAQMEKEKTQLSERQKELLKEQEENSPEEAAKHAEETVGGDTAVEQEISTPVVKKSYSDLTEFSQYISYQFYTFHTGKITAVEFYENISPHYTEYYQSIVPEKKVHQIEMYETLQELFQSQLEYAIIDYFVTEPKVEKDNEAYFYRRYELANGQSIYYLTMAQKVGDIWKLYDDSPTPSYEISEEVKSESESTEKRETK